MLETCHFQRVHYTVVGVRCFSNFERKLHAWLQLVLIVLDDLSVVLWKWPMNLEKRWVREEQIWVSTWELTLNQSNNLIRRPFEESFPSFSLARIVFVHYIVTKRHLDHTTRELILPIVFLFLLFL